MHPTGLTDIKQQLLRLKLELTEMQQVYQESSKPVELDQCTVGRLSRMDAIQAQQMSLGSEQRRQIKLRQIDAALHRIDSKDYGECFICGEEIDLRRLQADPTHTRCLDCADK